MGRESACCFSNTETPVGMEGSVCSMGISLLWPGHLSLGSGKWGNVEVKEIPCPTCLPNTNKAHRLFRGERRSVRLKSGWAVNLRVPAVCSAPGPHSSVAAGELVCWPKQTDKQMIYGKLLSHAWSHSCHFLALRKRKYTLLAGSAHKGLSTQHIPAGMCCGNVLC